MPTTDTLQHINCPICNQDGTKLLFTKDSLSVVKCKGCGLRYVNPRLTAPRLEAGYVEGYYPQEKIDRIHTNDMDWLQMGERLAEIERRFPEPGRMLDVGCGIGTFLHLARENGWETCGVELSVSGTKFAREQHGLDVFCGDVFEAGFPDGHFDVITLYHVLEHIPEPNPLIAELRRILKPKTGRLVIEVPNGESLQSRLQRADWPYVHPKDHLYYFSARTLSKLLRKHGFDSIRIGRPKRVNPGKNVKFAVRRAMTAVFVQFCLGTVIRVYAGYN